MKRITALLLAIFIAVSFAACTAKTDTDTQKTENETESAAQTAEAVTDTDISAKETTSAFSLTSADGTFENSGNVYTLTTAGTYTLEGFLEGQIVVDAGDDDEVVIELSGATISCGTDSPIKVLNADKVEISAKKNTENVINDTRSSSLTDDTLGKGAIYAKCDLKMKGKGTLVVNSAYNNGIHTTKDLEIQNLSLKVTAPSTALKGDDSVTVTSGEVVAISTGGDGIKTENTDVSKNGVTRGDIIVCGGSVTVYAAGDAFQTAHSFEMSAGESEPAVTVYTGSYSGYTSSDAATTSYKGVKVQNEINILAGSITLQTYDDGLHADYGTAFDDGQSGLGTINISGGTVTMNVYAPENKTAGGRMGPGSWGGQQTVIGADGIHADGSLNISGGEINIDSAYEGLEANIINVSGGKTYVAANDDGVNACKGDSAPQINVTGGYLDVTVSPNGDTDGIDSNGTYNQTGGVVITRGPGSDMAAAIDADGSVNITSGTLIVLGYGRVSTGGNVKQISLSLHSSGSHTVTVDGTKYTFTNSTGYSSTSCYSDVSVSS